MVSSTIEAFDGPLALALALAFATFWAVAGHVVATAIEAFDGTLAWLVSLEKKMWDQSSQVGSVIPSGISHPK